MKQVLILLFLSLQSLTSFAQSGNIPFVEELLAKMTIDEKIGQFNLQPAGDITTGTFQGTHLGRLASQGRIGGVFNIKGTEKIKDLQRMAVKESRLGIPLIVGMDVIHGYETIFPIPLAMSCSWNLEGIERCARVAALEASSAGINWVFSPMVDIALDARWGRIAESSGEDPYLGSLIAKAMVKGYQGDFSRPYNVLACVKHYALYGAAEGGRDYNTVDMSRLRMFNRYFPPYKAAVEAGVGSVMTSFNIVDGQHATANKWLLDDLLRRKWKFDGLIVSDYGAIGEMTSHGFGDLKHNSVLALKAGTDMDMCSNGYVGTLKQSLSDGAITEEHITNACRRILEAKYKLGLFRNPYKYISAQRERKYIYTKDNRKVAREMAAETFVLLKNANNILPLKKQGKIALIGPLADTRNNITGCWSVAHTPNKYTTLREAMTEALKGHAQLLYAQGCNICKDANRQKIFETGRTIPRVDAEAACKEALQIAKEADVIVCAMGETAEMSGESASRADLTLPDAQLDLLKQLVVLGKPLVLLNFSGRPTAMEWESNNVPAIMNVWFGGSEVGDALCDVLFGDKVPSGRLTTSIPRVTGHEPLYYNSLNTGRPASSKSGDYNKYRSDYIDYSVGALYPFGFGLSYTTFKYGMITVTGSGRNFTVSIPVSNVGRRDAYEVVQLYIHDLYASVARPVKELKAFERIFLKAGETKVVTMNITEQNLTYYDAEGNRIFEPGEFEIMIGPNSRDLQIKKVRAE